MVQNNIKSIAVFYLQMIVIWTGVVTLLIFLRNFGVDPEGRDTLIQGQTLGQIMTVNLFVGTLAAVFYSTLELVSEWPYFQKHSYGRIIFVKFLLFLVCGKLMMMLGISFSGIIAPKSIAKGEMMALVNSDLYWVLLVYFLLSAAIISFVRMVSQKFGPGVLWNMMIGKYRSPREEVRVFMFLDLKSSTAIAERLGHIKFSRLIQSCFADLTPIVKRHNVEIYQYVGDEAVLSWPLEKGFENNNCLHCYFDYMALLNRKASHYLAEYEINPDFKAGVHLGKVIVAEVGLIKREIAYHGDVLNTTARIQGKCNEFEQKLLVSEAVLPHMKPDQEIQSLRIGEESLKGKQQKVTIYAVTKN
ncbi:MAG: adenylate/guanylate cyclase domain-containing protein [Bacteroidota bacterium]